MPNLTATLSAPPGPRIETVIRGLPATQREIIVATYFRRRTVQEAARDLGITLEDAREHLYRAVHQLATAIDGRSSVVRHPDIDRQRWVAVTSARERA